MDDLLHCEHDAVFDSQAYRRPGFEQLESFGMFRARFYAAYPEFSTALPAYST